MENEQAKILVADDDEVIRLSFKKLLEKENLPVAIVPDGESALKILAQQSFAMAFIDLMMPGISGMELLQKIRENYPQTKVIIITGFGTINAAVEAMKNGAVDFIQKPFTPDEIRTILKKYFYSGGIREQQDKELRFERDGKAERIIGNSPKMREIRDLVLKVAPSDSTVLITGETGTGKELIAKAIHYNSNRKNKPFLTVDCSSLVETLFESELFGHVKGSFTGAVATKHGSFELANGGTFFFDEIGNISLNIQAKILRAIQEKEIKRVGGTETIKVDVRVIAATNKNLKKAIDEGTFREDLFYRLSVIPIHLPALRERKEDIIPLAEHFLNLYNEKRKKKLVGFQDSVLELFQEYHWPGNVRELENVVERAVVIEETNRISLSSLPSNIRNLRKKTGPSATSPMKTLEEMEKELIMQTLEQTNWNRSKTARILGIDRKTLYDKLKRYNLSKED